MKTLKKGKKRRQPRAYLVKTIFPLLSPPAEAGSLATRLFWRARSQQTVCVSLYTWKQTQKDTSARSPSPPIARTDSHQGQSREAVQSKLAAIIASNQQAADENQQAIEQATEAARSRIAAMMVENQQASGHLKRQEVGHLARLKTRTAERDRLEAARLLG